MVRVRGAGIGSVYCLAFALSHEHFNENVELWSIVAFAIALSVIGPRDRGGPVMRGSSTAAPKRLARGRPRVGPSPPGEVVLAAGALGLRGVLRPAVRW